MAPTLPAMDIYVVRAPRESQSRQKYTAILRELRLQSLRDDPEAFTEKQDAASARPMDY